LSASGAGGWTGRDHYGRCGCFPDGRVGLFVKVHHVVGDGIATVAAAGAFLDPTPGPLLSEGPQWTAVEPPTKGQLLVDNARRTRAALSTLGHPLTGLRRARATWPAVRELLTVAPAPTASLNRLVGPGRRLAILRCDLDAVRSVAHLYNAKVNDILLAATAAGLGRLLRHRGGPVDDAVVPVYVPVTLRRGAYDRAQGNFIGQMVVPLPIGDGDAGGRLRRIAVETARRKARPRPPLGALFRGRLISGALLTMMNRHPVNVTTADLPGPRQPMYLAGARVLEMFPVLPLIATVSLGIGALSYAGQLGIMVIADEVAYPDLDVFVAGAHDELTRLAVQPYP
jgi:WS/DGAT/MGAT family acyltransferase